MKAHGGCWECRVNRAGARAIAFANACSRILMDLAQIPEFDLGTLRGDIEATFIASNYCSSQEEISSLFSVGIYDDGSQCTGRTAKEE